MALFSVVTPRPSPKLAAAFPLGNFLKEFQAAVETSCSDFVASSQGLDDWIAQAFADPESLVLPPPQQVAKPKASLGQSLRALTQSIAAAEAQWLPTGSLGQDDDRGGAPKPLARGNARHRTWTVGVDAVLGKDKEVAKLGSTLPCKGAAQRMGSSSPCHPAAPKLEAGKPATSSTCPAPAEALGLPYGPKGGFGSSVQLPPKRDTAVEEVSMSAPSWPTLDVPKEWQAVPPFASTAPRDEAKGGEPLHPTGAVPSPLASPVTKAKPPQPCGSQGVLDARQSWEAAASNRRWPSARSDTSNKDSKSPSVAVKPVKSGDLVKGSVSERIKAFESQAHNKSTTDLHAANRPRAGEPSDAGSTSSTPLAGWRMEKFTAAAPGMNLNRTTSCNTLPAKPSGLQARVPHLLRSQTTQDFPRSCSATSLPKADALDRGFDSARSAPKQSTKPAHYPGGAPSSARGCGSHSSAEGASARPADPGAERSGEPNRSLWTGKVAQQAKRFEEGKKAQELDGEVQEPKKLHIEPREGARARPLAGAGLKPHGQSASASPRFQAHQPATVALGSKEGSQGKGMAVARELSQAPDQPLPKPLASQSSAQQLLHQQPSQEPQHLFPQQQLQQQQHHQQSHHHHLFPQPPQPQQQHLFPQPQQPHQHLFPQPQQQPQQQHQHHQQVPQPQLQSQPQALPQQQVPQPQLQPLPQPLSQTLSHQHPQQGPQPMQQQQQQQQQQPQSLSQHQQQSQPLLQQQQPQPLLQQQPQPQPQPQPSQQQPQQQPQQPPPPQQQQQQRCPQQQPQQQPQQPPQQQQPQLKEGVPATIPAEPSMPPREAAASEGAPPSSSTAKCPDARDGDGDSRNSGSSGGDTFPEPPPLEPWMLIRQIDLPAKRLEDNYELSDRGLDSDDETAERERSRKRIPEWCKTFLEDLSKQADVDPDTIFGNRVPTCCLEDIFTDSVYREVGKNRPRRHRGSSGNWSQDRLTRQEVSAYKNLMGHQRMWSDTSAF